MTGPDGRKRIIMWSGLHPARLAVTEDDGETWSELKKVGDWGGIVVMGCHMELKTGKGHYLCLFHDDGRFFEPKPVRKNPVEFRLYQTNTTDGGLTWSQPRVIQKDSAVHLCEPGIVRSPDGKEFAVPLRKGGGFRLVPSKPCSFVSLGGENGKNSLDLRRYQVQIKDCL